MVFVVWESPGGWPALAGGWVYSMKIVFPLVIRILTIVFQKSDIPRRFAPRIGEK
jgi:hypothetical protein